MKSQKRRKMKNINNKPNKSKTETLGPKPGEGRDGRCVRWCCDELCNIGWQLVVVEILEKGSWTATCAWSAFRKSFRVATFFPTEANVERLCEQIVDVLHELSLW